MREARVEQYLVRQVEKAGGRCLKFVSPGQRHVFDRLVLWPTRNCKGFAIVHFVECKAPGKTLRPGQKREYERLMAGGFGAFVIATHEKVDLYVQHYS